MTRLELVEKMELEVRKLRHAIPLTDGEWAGQLRNVYEFAHSVVYVPTHKAYGKRAEVRLNGAEVRKVVQCCAGKDGWVEFAKVDADGNMQFVGNDVVTEILHGNVEVREVP